MTQHSHIQREIDGHYRAYTPSDVEDDIGIQNPISDRLSGDWAWKPLGRFVRRYLGNAYDTQYAQEPNPTAARVLFGPRNHSGTACY